MFLTFSDPSLGSYLSKLTDYGGQTIQKKIRTQMTWEIQMGRNQICRLRDVGGLESWTGCLKPDAMKRLLACSDIMIEFRSSNLMKGMRIIILLPPADCIMKSLKKI